MTQPGREEGRGTAAREVAQGGARGPSERHQLSDVAAPRPLPNCATRPTCRPRVRQRGVVAHRIDAHVRARAAAIAQRGGAPLARAPARARPFTAVCFPRAPWWQAAGIRGAPSSMCTYAPEVCEGGGARVRARLRRLALCEARANYTLHSLTPVPPRYSLDYDCRPSGPRAYGASSSACPLGCIAISSGVR